MEGPTLERMATAALLAVAGTLSLLLGAAVGVYARPARWVTAAVMAFGSGALIQALAVDLASGAAARLIREFGHPWPEAWLVVAVGFVAGGLLYSGVNRLLDERGGALRKPATAEKFLLEKKREEADELLRRLARVHLLRALPPEEMEDVLPCVHPVRFAAGETIFHQGDVGDALYLVDQGQVDILASGADETRVVRLNTLRDGDSFGEMALLNGHPRSGTAVAVTETTGLKILKEDFDHLVQLSPALRRAVEALNARRLVETAELMRDTVDADEWRRTAVRSIERLTRTEHVALAEKHAGAPLAIFMGSMLDGIPECIVVGAKFTTLATFSPTFLVAVFLSNLPESMSSAAGMREAGFRPRRIFTLWGGLVAASAAAAALGNALLPGAPPMALAFVEALAGGSILAMLASTMMPEAFEHGGPSVGLATIAGFLSAFFFATAGLGGPAAHTG